MVNLTPHIRPAVVADLPEIQIIYAHYVLNGLASFELTPPDITELENRWQVICHNNLPYLVVEIDGQIGGYAYASSFRPRPAYNNTVEDSVYVSPDFLGQGLGHLLLTALIEACTALGLRQMIAVIGDSQNHASINLHTKCGFTQVGVMPSTGYKLDQWVDTVLMQRPLGDGDTTPPKEK
ncbi:MAG: N-acetyltransferase [Rhodospirillaceae bacterium]|jgi:L-amino acid N-acyltransferase YncA|nr:N-acetyltransferase [Rhodospirillaceae bacterium]MBT4588354.1 N-acetyltransferase [Rhodospirillaceae bacterium]MBT4940198.1 N-acetyltransferase [Rhodospirillaceae bacterium]MBT7266059.1 N-acetyltransferase [Rhodospirillaceae bacterium]